MALFYRNLFHYPQTGVKRGHYKKQREIHSDRVTTGTQNFNNRVIFLFKNTYFIFYSFSIISLQRSVMYMYYWHLFFSFNPNVGVLSFTCTPTKSNCMKKIYYHHKSVLKKFAWHIYFWLHFVIRVQTCRNCLVELSISGFTGECLARIPLKVGNSDYAD